MAFVIPEAGLPLGDSLTAHTTNIPSCITYLAVEEGSTFEIKQHMLNILPTFHGLSSDDPNMHIAEFLMGCKNILVRGFSVESIKLRLFPYTLKDQARRWLLTLPSGSITTWAQLSERFLNKYYPASKTLDMRTRILSFAQKPNEEFHDAWERFKELIRKCPHSGINTTDQMHIFFRGLNMTTKTLVNASCGAQIEKMEKRLDAKFDMLLQKIPSSQVAVQQPLQAACKIYSLTNHDFLSCPHKDAYPEFMVEQIALQVSERAPGTFPRQTVPNPRGREECNAIRTLRSGKSYNRHENSVGNSQAAEQLQTKSAIFADSENSADSGQSQDRSENTAEATTKTAECVYEPPMPYPERLKPKAKDQQLTDFMKTLAKVQINLSLIDAIKNIPSYAKFFKDICTKKKKLVDSEKSEGELKPTSIIIQLADGSITYPRGVIEDVIVKVDNLYLPVDFMVLDMDEDLTTPIILGCPFLATTRTLIDVEAGILTFRVEDQIVVFKLFEASIHSGSPDVKKIQPGKKVWLLNTSFKLVPAKQESRWKGLYMVKQVFQNGNMDIEPEGMGCLLKVKKYQLKPCIGKFGESESLTLKAPVI
ncbi:unnamed protein product [Malus baccata var. baccata]